MNEITELKKQMERMIKAKAKIEQAENRQWNILEGIIGTDALESFRESMVEIFETKKEADDLLREIQGKIETLEHGERIWGGGAER